ncbi:Peptidyl-prolyl cis-trans isomerase FKBP62 [Theileria parva strain Muguga]|uniref:Peptidyl-prolyl cis-trans isomerase FKBP62 n=1 Tax=Theileria parva strain Muguga TaxID=333668 RepID=UPI001C61A5A3|nr:Peptidyl-prolyl cis-trans isomerase FKBP62 [Theileria parva strain Muguga]EAN33741.2 Peptidyl-prolyl cis-trans isomerase FKBP62 [Theileria parva strain Muguga]
MDVEGYVRVGLDFGGDSCRVSVVDNNNKINLHVNRLANRQTPSIISFDKRLRIYGEEAEARSSTLFRNTIPLLPYIVGLGKEELLKYVKEHRYLFLSDVDEATGSFKVTFDDSPLLVHPFEAYAFFVNKLLHTVRTQFNCTNDSNEKIMLSIAVPTYLTEQFKKSVQYSLSLLKLKEVKLFKESECILKRWSDSQLPDAYNEFVNLKGTQNGETGVNQRMRVVFLDVGFVHTTFFVAEIASEESTLTAKIISESSTDTIGTYQVFEVLCDYIKQQIEKNYNTKLEIPSRQSYYLYKSCVKCVKELSVLNDVKLDVERVLPNDDDFSTIVARQQLHLLTQPIQNGLNNLMKEVMSKVDEGVGYYSFEMLGGGSRMPFIKDLATEYSGLLNCVRGVRTSLDTTSAVSYGATSLLVNSMGQTTQTETTYPDPAHYNEMLEREKYVRNVEQEEMNKMMILNEIDNYVIKTRNDLTGTYKHTVDPETMEKIGALLDGLQSFSTQSISDKSVTSESCTNSLSSVQEKVKELAPDYLLKLEKDAEQRLKDQKLSESLPINHVQKEVDMDVVLPNGTCIKRAQKNKDEGNELIGAGNVELAIQHYIKVIQYCAKVTNPNQDEKTVINQLRLATNLNLAMCYLRMDVPASYNKAVSCCTSALDISPKNTKALFRRAVAYEKLNDFENSLKDANQGLQLDANNQDFKIICDRVEKKIKLELQKQKKMFSKMFG